MPASDALIVTFAHQGREYNIWVWPHAEGGPGSQVNFREDGRWFPVVMDGGVVQAVETQGALF